jgi:N-acetylglucosamine kinase-like BadF-type ATPase
LGDEGSGYAIVVAGLRAVAQAADGRGPKTRLTELFLGRFGLNEEQELVPAVYPGAWDRAALAGLAPLVLAAADDNDPVAGSIIAEAVDALAHTAAAAARQLELQTKEIPLALAGGILVQAVSYRERFLERLESLRIKADPVNIVREPAEGAVRLAMRVA